MATIGIDARMYGLEHAGIGRYIENLVAQVTNLHAGHQFTLFLTDAHYGSLKVADNVKKVRANIRHYSLAEQTEFLQILNANPVDLMHFPHFNVPLMFNRPFVVTIHDILWHQVKGLSVTTLNPVLYALKYMGYRAVVRHAVTASRAIIVPSNWVKDQVLHQFSNVPEKKVQVTYEAVDTEFLHMTSESHKPKKLPDTPYLLYTGSAYPHKNVHLLIEAAAQMRLSGSPVTLVIVGSRSVFIDKLRALVNKLNLNDTVIFLGYVTDQELIYVYHHAVALVHPSTSEGFGLTGLEAMSTGTPVLAAKAGSLPEVYGNGALYFKPGNVADMIAKIHLIQSDQKLRAELIRNGYDREKLFNWTDMGEKTLKIYQSVL